jgi:hypothetical protein
VVWGAASSSIILLNKSLISEHGFHAPMLLASLGQLTSRCDHPTASALRVSRVQPSRKGTAPATPAPTGAFPLPRRSYHSLVRWKVVL